MSRPLEWVDLPFMRSVLDAVAELESGAQGCIHWTSGDWYLDCHWCIAADIVQRRDAAKEQTDG